MKSKEWSAGKRQQIRDEDEKKKKGIICVITPTFLFFNSSSPNLQLAILICRQLCTFPIFHPTLPTTSIRIISPQWPKALLSSDSWTWSPVRTPIPSLKYNFYQYYPRNVSMQLNSRKSSLDTKRLSPLCHSFHAFGVAHKLGSHFAQMYTWQPKKKKQQHSDLDHPRWYPPLCPYRIMELWYPRSFHRVSPSLLLCEWYYWEEK